MRLPPRDESQARGRFAVLSSDDDDAKQGGIDDTMEMFDMTRDDSHGDDTPRRPSRCAGSDRFRPNRFRPIPLQASTVAGQIDLFMTCSGLTCLGQCRFKPTCCHFGSWQDFLVFSLFFLHSRETAQHAPQRMEFDCNSEWLVGRARAKENSLHPSCQNL